MRKIAANYILLPGFELVKNGYVVLKDGKFLVSNSTGECLLTILYGKISSGLPVIRFVKKFYNYTKGILCVGMALPLFKGLILPVLSGCRNPGLYICVKLNTKINEG